MPALCTSKRALDRVIRSQDLALPARKNTISPIVRDSKVSSIQLYRELATSLLQNSTLSMDVQEIPLRRV